MPPRARAVGSPSGVLSAGVLDCGAARWTEPFTPPMESLPYSAVDWVMKLGCQSLVMERPLEAAVPGPWNQSATHSCTLPTMSCTPHRDEQLAAAPVTTGPGVLVLHWVTPSPLAPGSG